MQTEEYFRRFDDAAAFLSADGEIKVRSTEKVPVFHLDKGKRGFPENHYVDFAWARPEIARHDAVPFVREQRSHGIFSLFPFAFPAAVAEQKLLNAFQKIPPCPRRVFAQKPSSRFSFVEEIQKYLQKTAMAMAMAMRQNCDTGPGYKTARSESGLNVLRQRAFG